MRHNAMAVAVALLLPAVVLGRAQLTGALSGGDQPAPQPLPVEGGRTGAITGSLDGVTVSQPIADPAADVQIFVMPQSDEAMIGVPFRFAVRVIADPVRTAVNARIRIAATARRLDGTIAPAGEVMLTRAIMPQDGNRPPQECTIQSADRVCALGDLAPGADAQVSGELRTTAGTQPGELILTVITRLGTAELPPSENVVKLVPRRQLSNVGLTLDVASDADVAAMGFDFAHTVSVSNWSNSESASRVMLEIRQRAVAQSDGAYTPLAADGLQVSGLEQCVLLSGTYRCMLGTLAAGQEVRLPVQLRILKDLPSRRSGKIETQARVRSAEVDPEPDDNFGKQVTTLLSRQPQLAFLTPVKGSNGQTRFVEQDRLVTGEPFGIGARFMHVLVEPEDIVVRVAVNGAAPVDVPLRKPLVGQGSIYRSGPLRVSAAPARGSAADAVIRANNGDQVRVSYQRTSATATVVGAR